MQFRAQANQVLILSYKSYDKKTKRPNVELIATVNTKNWVLTMKENKAQPGTFHVFTDAEKAEYENELWGLQYDHERVTTKKRIKAASDALRTLTLSDCEMLTTGHFGNYYERNLDEAFVPLFALSEFIKRNYKDSKYLNLTTENVESVRVELFEKIKKSAESDERYEAHLLKSAEDEAKIKANKAYDAAKRLIDAHDQKLESDAAEQLLKPSNSIS